MERSEETKDATDTQVTKTSDVLDDCMVPVDIVEVVVRHVGILSKDKYEQGAMHGQSNGLRHS